MNSSQSRNAGCPTLAAFLFLRLGWGWVRGSPIAFWKFQSCALRGGPCGLDLYGSFNSCCIVPETGPRPIFRLRDQAAGYRIAVHIAEFFDALWVRVDVEVVISRQPEWPLLRLLGNGGHQSLHGAGKGSLLRLRDQKVDVLRHHNIAEDMKDIAPASLFQDTLEEVTRCRMREIR